MKVLLKNSISLLVTLATLLACSTDTLDFGDIQSIEGVVNRHDQVETETATFEFTTCTEIIGDIITNNRKCLLGAVRDAETKTVVKADYACLLHTLEGEVFPSFDRMVCDENGNFCDSVILHLFFNDWYGDINVPMKLKVFEIDKGKVDDMVKDFQEKPVGFWSSQDLSKYAKSNEIKTLTYTVWDRTVPNATLNATNYQHSIRIKLDRKIGENIINAYKENPKKFQSSYTFAKEVFPGFYIKYDQGEGAVVNIQATNLEVYSTYKLDNKKEVIYSTFVGSAESLQASNIEYKDKESLFEDLINNTKCSYLKGPAGLCTEFTLPVDEILSEKHLNDSLARVQIVMKRDTVNSYKLKTEDGVVFNAPQTIGMISDWVMESFDDDEFEKKFINYFATSTISNDNVTYDFANIALLVRTLDNLRRENAKKEGKSILEWTNEHPNWNKVVILPVTVTLNSLGVISDLLHESALTSTKLVGGKDNKLKINVTYSRYK